MKTAKINNQYLDLFRDLGYYVITENKWRYRIRHDYYINDEIILDAKFNRIYHWGPVSKTYTHYGTQIAGEYNDEKLFDFLINNTNFRKKFVLDKSVERIFEKHPQYINVMLKFSDQFSTEIKEKYSYLLSNDLF